jgi:hypothetical protein
MEKELNIFNDVGVFVHIIVSRFTLHHIYGLVGLDDASV